MVAGAAGERERSGRGSGSGQLIRARVWARIAGVGADRRRGRSYARSRARALVRCPLPPHAQAREEALHALQLPGRSPQRIDDVDLLPDFVREIGGQHLDIAHAAQDDRVVDGLEVDRRDLAAQRQQLRTIV